MVTGGVPKILGLLSSTAEISFKESGWTNSSLFEGTCSPRVGIILREREKGGADSRYISGSPGQITRNFSCKTVRAFDLPTCIAWLRRKAWDVCRMFCISFSIDLLARHDTLLFYRPVCGSLWECRELYASRVGGHRDHFCTVHSFPQLLPLEHTLPHNT